MALTTIKSSNLAPGSIEISDLEDSGVTAQSYGSASEVPVITVNAKGIITAATTTTVAGVTDFDYNIATGVLDIDTADGSNFSTTVTLGPFDTDDLTEGSSNLYYTDARVSNYLTTNSYVTSSDITTAINNLIDSAPGTLDTLNELAASLGDDADFAGTMTTSLAGKVDKINITGATVGSGTAIPVITYNAQGQITSATTTNVTIGDATLTVSSGSGLTGSGTFTANATSNGTITLSHDDTSTLSGSYGQTSTEDGTYIKSITVDGFGHLTAVTTDDFDDRYLGITAKAADSDLLDGINSSSFLHTGITDFTSSSGTSTGWRIFRDNTRSWILFDQNASNGVGAGSDYAYIGSDATQLKGLVGITDTNISNSTPDGALHIKSATNKTINLDYQSSNSSGSFSWLSFERNGTNKFRIFGYNDDQGLGFINDLHGSTHLFLDDNGNTSLGTTGQSTSKLYVLGNSGGGKGIVVEQSADAGFDHLQLINTSTGSSAYTQMRLTAGGTGDSAYIFRNSANRTANGGAGGLTIWNENSGNVFFYLNGAKRLEVKSSGNLEITGNYETNYTAMPKPSLHQPFFLSKQIDSRLEFKRTGSNSPQGPSVATYVGPTGLIEYSYDNQPRFTHDPMTGECLGLLMENNRTNYITYSNIQANAWSVGVSGDELRQDFSIMNPDGSPGAMKHYIGSGTGWHRVYKTVSIPSATTSYYWSVFVKKIADGSNNYGRYFEIEVSGNFSNPATVTYDLDTGTYYATGSAAAYNIKMEEYPNGWWRCGFAHKNHGTTSGNVWFGVPTSATAGDSSMAGDNSHVHAYWGAQCEDYNYGGSQVKTFMTSYIPTTIATQARGQDKLFIKDMTGMFNNGTIEHTALIDYIPLVQPEPSATNFAIYQLFGNNNNYVSVRHDNGTQLTCQHYNGTTYIGPSGGGMTNYGDTYRLGVRWKNQDSVQVRNGAVQATDSASFNTSFETWYYGYISSDGGQPLGLGIIRSISFYTQTLTNQQLIELTDPDKI